MSPPRNLRGQSSLTNSAAATATGTPIRSAVAEVISVPTSRGRAPNTSRETSQLFVKTNPKNPNLWNAGLASTYSRTKKNAISTRIRNATSRSPFSKAMSWRRTRGSRPMDGRLPLATAVVLASMPSRC